MDPRQSLSRTGSSNVGTPQAPYGHNMASAYAMPPYQNNTHLPPINYSQLPPASQGYMPQQYRPELPRYSAAPAPPPIPSPAPDHRYNQHMAPQPSMAGLPPSSALPQPHNQPPQQQQPPQGYQSQAPRQSYPQPLAPAPPRADPLQPGYGPPDNRQQPWSGAEGIPSMAAEVGRDPTRTHVVGSQGRRGILPSAPGRPAVMPNGMNGSPKSSAVPQKDADGKFPCPNCTKTYLHAKHLKRHMLRHTGDRPYMCVLCNDTFSRSDILKRHFQKCSVRRGNPTGASHLSNPAAHIKKNQQKQSTASPASATTPSSAVMPNPPYTSAAMPNVSAPTTSAPAPGMAYPMQPNGQGDMQRQGQPMQPGSGPGGMDPNANNWGAMQQHQRNNQMMYHSNAATDHFGMQPGGGDDKRNVMPGSHHMGDDWNHMFPAGGNEGYMNPMFGTYEQSQTDVKKDFENHEGGSNGYYIPSTSLGADGTLGTPLWNLHASQQDLFKPKVNALLTFIFPGGLQESLRDPQNDLVRSCLTVEAVQHFLELFSNFQGHFPWLHLPTFNFATAYDGLILVIICSGAAFSNRVSHYQVRALMQLVKAGIERTSRLLHNLEPGVSRTQLSSSGLEFEELLALHILQSLFVWHGSPDERALARDESKRVLYLVRQLSMLTLAGPEDPLGYSYLHSLQPGEEADPSRWDWRAWLEQEKRSRLMYTAYLWDATMCIYFNVPPHFSAAEIKLPLPCDDAAWDAPDAESCAQALGLRGPDAQIAINISGSLRLKQLEMHHAMSALYSHSVVMQPRTTNVYSKFILIHAVHMEIWHLQRQHLFDNTLESNLHGEADNMYSPIHVALTRWKQAWDEDYSLQYHPGHDYRQHPRRVGFCRDGVHFYWLARALLQPGKHQMQLSADDRLRQVIHQLKKARDWSRTDGTERSEEPGSIAFADDDYAAETLEVDMKKLFRPIQGSPGTSAQGTGHH